MTKWQVCGAGFWDLRQGHWTSLPRLKVTRLCALTTVVIVIQALSHVWLFGTPWTAACQASLSFTISRSLLKLMSIESVMLSNHLILCDPLLLHSIFPSIRVFFNRQLLHQVVKVLELQLQHQSFQWIFRVDFHGHGRSQSQESAARSAPLVRVLVLALVLAGSDLNAG